MSDWIRSAPNAVAPVIGLDTSPVMDEVRLTPIWAESAFTITRFGAKPVAIARLSTPSPTYEPLAMRSVLKQEAAWKLLPELDVVATNAA